MSTEEETFRRLCKSDFDTVLADMTNRTQSADQVLNQHGWNQKEFDTEIDRRLYNKVLSILFDVA